MSICLPNLRTTSVFKVYYGGTGVTTLTSGAVVIGNGTDAVQCITGSEGQVLTWDSTSGSWVAKDPTGGTGGGTGISNVPDIVIAPANSIPTNIIKKRISNHDYRNNCKLIDWDNSGKGSFRICAQDSERKYVTVYNDSKKDLFISVANDENPKIVIDFEKASDIQDLKIKYVYNSESILRTLFDYSIDQIQDIHSYHTFSQEPSIKYGYGKNYSVNNCGEKARLTINLTPDYFSENLNKYLRCIPEPTTGSYHIYLSNSSGIRSDIQEFNISCSAYSFEQQNYTIYTKVSGTQFLSSSLITSSIETQNTNGFYLEGLDHTNRKNLDAAPEEYSYILYSEETLTLSEKEATLPIFGYLIEPNGSTLVIRVTEAR